MQAVVSHLNRKAVILFGVFFCVVLLLGAGCLSDDEDTSYEQTANSQPSGANTNPPTSVSTASQSCGKNLDCFVSAAQTCSPATVSHTFTDSLVGINITLDESYTLSGTPNNCSLILKANGVSIAYTPEVKNLLKNTGGYTDAEIAEFERDDKVEAPGVYLGKSSTCVFSSTDALVTVLNTWRNSDRNVDVLSVASCTGPYLSAELDAVAASL